MGAVAFVPAATDMRYEPFPVQDRPLAVRQAACLARVRCRCVRLHRRSDNPVPAIATRTAAGPIRAARVRAKFRYESRASPNRLAPSSPLGVFGRVYAHVGATREWPPKSSQSTSKRSDTLTDWFSADAKAAKLSGSLH